MLGVHCNIEARKGMHEVTTTSAIIKKRKGVSLIGHIYRIDNCIDLLKLRTCSPQLQRLEVCFGVLQTGVIG